jgi:hypothetical protein
MTKDDGFAFPWEKVEHGDYMLPASQGGVTIHKFPGMTLRDYFAAKAMQGKLAAGGAVGTYEDEAEDCYIIADAMLEARK